MDIQLGDTDVTLGEVADAGKAASSFTKSLPGMTKSDGDGGEEPKVCETCHQKIVTNQPGGIDGAIATADGAANCCNKAFDCFGKGLDAADKVQQLSGGEA